VIFGTAWRPKPHEFPTTGLMSGEVPAGFVDLLVWPMRHCFARSQTMIDRPTASSARTSSRVISSERQLRMKPPVNAPP